MISIQNLSFSYSKKPVFQDFNETVRDGEIVAIMGPSGCGKTTLLHLIAGLLKPSGGKISSGTEKISYVFQEPRLFPRLSVRQNFDAVLDTPLSSETYETVLSSLGLSGVLNLLPEELSVGMQMRVSLARSLLYDGDLFLLDEPFAALDGQLRKEITTLLKKNFKKSNKTAILVTHNEEDASLFADRIIQL